MKTLKELIPERQFVVAPQVDEKTIFYVAKRILTEEFGSRGGENLIPTYYKNHKLYLSPKSSLWASEALLNRDRLLQRLNMELGREEVLEIRLGQQI